MHNHSKVRCARLYYLLLVRFPATSHGGAGDPKLPHFSLMGNDCNVYMHTVADLGCFNEGTKCRRHEDRAAVGGLGLGEGRGLDGGWVWGGNF